jgi:hypothetical protein
MNRTLSAIILIISYSVAGFAQNDQRWAVLPTSSKPAAIDIPKDSPQREFNADS